MTDPVAIAEQELPAPLAQAIEQFDKWCRAALSEQEANDRIEKPLYHYTNAAGLMGIFDSQRLWLTDYRHLNDPKELHHGLEIAHGVLRAALEGADRRAGLFLRDVIDLFRKENLENLVFFVACFSRARNDLGQWRAYADNGRGFAIGYAPRMFEVRAEMKPSPDENAFLGPVLYGPDEAAARNRLVVDRAAAIFLETVDANASLMSNKAIGFPFMRLFGLQLIASALIWNALTAKHMAYRAEEEVRLIVMGTIEALLPVTSTRARGSEIVPYVAHAWAARGPEDIAEIVVGPAAPADAERTLETLLAARGIAGVKIERSDIPYRAL